VDPRSVSGHHRGIPSSPAALRARTVWRCPRR